MKATEATFVSTRGAFKNSQHLPLMCAHLLHFLEILFLSVSICIQPFMRKPLELSLLSREVNIPKL